MILPAVPFGTFVDLGGRRPLHFALSVLDYGDGRPAVWYGRIQQTPTDPRSPG